MRSSSIEPKPADDAPVGDRWVDPWAAKPAPSATPGAGWATTTLAPSAPPAPSPPRRRPRPHYSDLDVALEVVGGAFKSEAVPEVCVEALLGVVAHLDVGHHGPSARSRVREIPPVSFRARAAIASSLPLPPRFRAIARPPRDRR